MSGLTCIVLDATMERDRPGNGTFKLDFRQGRGRHTTKVSNFHTFERDNGIRFSIVLLCLLAPKCQSDGELRLIHQGQFPLWDLAFMSQRCVKKLDVSKSYLTLSRFGSNLGDR